MTDFTTGTVAANGITLHYVRARAADRPSILLLHGLTANGRAWLRVARALTGDYDLVMLDARGHGRSDTPPTGYSPADHVADVVGVIEALDLGQPVLIGHSMGAEVAANVAAIHPDRVRALVLEDPPWHAREQTAAELAAQLPGWEQDLRDKQAMSLDRLAAHACDESPTWAPEDCRAWAESVHQASIEGLGFIHGEHIPWRELVPRIPCPLLLIHAETGRGAIVPSTVAVEVAQRPNARTVRIEGAGHTVHYDRFEPFMAAVRGFLAEIG